MRTIAIIPARGGSKRIPGKNVKEFEGQPIIAYSIRAALGAGCFDEVMVSTDSEEIAAVARRYGASVPFLRSEKTSDDYATTADVIREVLDRYAALGEKFDALCCIYATAPFVMPFRLREGMRILESGEREGAFTCVEYSYPVQRGLEIHPDGRIAMRWPEYAGARSQDLQKTYHDAGQFYFSTVEAFLRDGSLWGSNTAPIVLSELDVQDLDTETDWRLAEMKFRLTGFPERLEAAGFELKSYTLCPDLQLLEALAERNREEVRRFMINREPICIEDHLDFCRSLKFRREKVYYLILAGGRVAGSVNFEWIAGSTLERGIWITRDFRRQGIAGKLLPEVYAELHRRLGVKKIFTEVMTGNEASNALERKLGARLVATRKDMNEYELDLG